MGGKTEKAARKECSEVCSVLTPLVGGSRCVVYTVCTGNEDIRIWMSVLMRNGAWLQ